MDIGFSPDVQSAMKAAEAEARRQCIQYVSTEHLLLGLLATGADTPNLAIRVLRALGVTLEPLQGRLREHLGRGDTYRYDPAKPVELTGNARSVLAFAAVEASLTDSPSIFAEHLLIGLVRLERALAARVLAEQGVTIERCQETLRQLGTPGSDG